MSIEITEFADAAISISPVGVNLGNFGILAFLTDEIGIPTTERARAYSSMKEIADDWQPSSEVFKAATAFYSQAPTPKDFTVISMYKSDPIPTRLVGGEHVGLSELRKARATNYQMTIVVNGETAKSISVDFFRTVPLSIDEVVSKISLAFSNANIDVNCEIEGGKFILKTVAVGASATIAFPSGTLADDLGLTAAKEAKIYPGSTNETAVYALTQAKDNGFDYVGLDIIKTLRDKETGPSGTQTLDIAEWCESSRVIFMNCTNQAQTLNRVNTTDTASKLRNKNLNFSMTTYSSNIDQYPGSSAFGRAASVDFNNINSTITLNLKSMPGISAEKLSSTQLGALRAKNCNVVVEIGDRAVAFTDSRMANGSWFDSTHGLLWLEDRIEKDMFNLIYREPRKIPYSQLGINITKETLERSLIAAKDNGLCAPGLLSDGTYLPEGYIVESVSLLKVSSADKSNRIYTGLSFKMVGAGALHKISVQGTFSE